MTTRRGILTALAGMAALVPFVPWQARPKLGRFYATGPNRALAAWLRMHGLDPQFTRHVSIDMSIDDLPTLTVERYLKDEHGHKYWDHAVGDVATDTATIQAVSLPNVYLLREMRQEIVSAQPDDLPDGIADATAWAAPNRQYVRKSKEG
jgi:hypothetical protein